MTDAFKYFAATVFFFGQALASEALPVPATARESISINDHWRFTKGGPTSFESFRAPDRKTFNGLCLVIIRGQAGKPGALRLTAKIESLKIGTVTVTTLLL